MERARAVVVGGGITGASVAYHLAKAGWRDVVLLEKDELTSGSTCHAAGLVTQFNPSPTMMRFRRYSIDLYRELGIFEMVGSLRFASSREQWMELRRGASRARAIGLDVDVLSPEEAARLMPAITTESLFGALGWGVRLVETGWPLQITGNHYLDAAVEYALGPALALRIPRRSLRGGVFFCPPRSGVTMFSRNASRVAV